MSFHDLRWVDGVAKWTAVGVRHYAELARDPAFPDLLQTSSHGLEVRGFPAESPKARLIGETLEWEEQELSTPCSSSTGTAGSGGRTTTA